jgi:uncharacterized protein YbjT (DUF2867 family)
MFVITGATGNIGKRLCEILLEKKQKVRAIGRSPEKLKALSDRGTEVRTGLLEDSEFLMHAFRGATSVFVMIPPNYETEDMPGHQEKTGKSLVDAIRNSGVKQVVNLSSMGAELNEKTGPILGLHYQEKRLNELNGVNVLHLRPCSFMENQFSGIPLIKNMGITGSSIRPDHVMNHIATRDIAEVAAEEMMSGIRSQSARELIGPDDLTPVQVAKILGEAIGKPDLRYVQFSYEDEVKGMVSAGLTSSTAKLLVEMDQAMNEGLLRAIPHTEKNTTKTTFKEFAKTFAAVYAEQ